MAEQRTELTPEQLRNLCDPQSFHFTCTAELIPLQEVIGQDRAVHAISFGIDIKTAGYHLYALGPTGTGKTTILQKFLEREAAGRPVPDDWLYMHNFSNPDKPRALRLPAGTGRKLQKDMDKLVEELRGDVPQAFESAEYTRQHEQLGEELRRQSDELLNEVDQFARTQGLAVVQTPQGLLIAPFHDGEMMTPEEINHLDEATQKRIEEGQHVVQEHLRDAMRQMQQFQRSLRERRDELDRQTVSLVVEHYLDELKERYQAFVPVVKLLDEIRADIMKNVGAFRQMGQVEQMKAAEIPMAAMIGRQLPSFEEYRVNLIVDNAETSGAPVIVTRNPSYHNLVGRIEQQGQFGMLVTSFNMIKSGLLHKANGGYLMIDVRDLLTKPLAYEGLKRALKNTIVEIESLGEAYGLFATRTLDPEPIPLEIKVVLIGDPMIYYTLYSLDHDFQELFKVKVDFSVEMDRTPESTEQYARFIATVCQEEGLLPFDPSGVAKVVEHGSRLVSNQRKLVTKFGDVVDLIRQSHFWASKSGHALVTGDDVKRSIEEKVYRSNHLQERLQEAITDGTLLVDIAGSYVGQGNGLAVLSLGDYAFGRPSRITARYHVGNAGVVNIDREVKLGGPIHNKGAMIIASYLGGKYATQVPLALSASLTFEQTYEEIEGDSASSIELYTLLSALSGFPMRQELAVTGSVNQYGHVQAIGGVNEKIEGFFDICRLLGITGRQGVIIPQSNVQHLMLREDVVEAVRAGQFHIYPVETIDQGIEILTGKAAGTLQLDGSYAADTVNGTVHRRLRELAEKVRDFIKPEEPGHGDEEERRAA